MLLHTRGIVFRTVKYGETSVIADVFTEEKGLHTFVGGRVRSPRARMPFNLFQPMSAVDMVAYYRDDPNALNRLKELRADIVFERIPFDIRRGAIALFLAEICRKCIKEAEENRPLFAFLHEQLFFLDRTDASIANLPVVFLVQLSAYLGFQPETPEEAEGLYFDLREGVFTFELPPHGACLDTQSSAALASIMAQTMDDALAHPLAREQRKRLLHGLLGFYRWHVPGFEGVHTPEVMEWVWG